MPRPPRRAAAPAREQVTATPTRVNATIAAIPPFMLDTPPHAPFVTTPQPPTNPPAQSIVPERNQNRRNARTQHQTPTANGTQGIDPTQTSSNVISETGYQDEASILESMQHDTEETKALQGLRDISSLATWTLSSAKPGCALPQLRHPNTSLFWQSDGPQPHTLTLHFFKLVAIIKMRIYLDFDSDESYTPTKMKFFAGMSEGSLVEFGEWAVQEVTDPETGETRSTVENVKGWIDVPLKGVGGREKRYFEAAEEARGMNVHGEDRRDPTAGHALKAMVVQVFARDEAVTKEVPQPVKKEKTGKTKQNASVDYQGMLDLKPADWMGEPVIR